MANPQIDPRGILHRLTSDEWALIMAYRGCCLEHRENIRFFAYETMQLCHESNDKPVEGASPW